MARLRYFFDNVEVCNMCGHSTTGNKILGQRLNTSVGLNPKSNSGISVTVEQCQNCNLIYSNPQPVPVDIQDHYGIPPEEYWKEEYFTYDPSYFSHEISILRKLGSPIEGAKALDIGAGLGKAMITLGNAGFDTYGLEPSVSFRQKALDKMGIDPDRLKLGMMEELDYPEENFDFITFGAVLEHLYDPAAAIGRAMKWLKPHGYIQIEVPSSRWFVATLFNFYYRLRGTHYVTNLSPMHEPFHMHEFDLKSFTELSKRLGFEIALHEYYVCDVFYLPRILHGPLRWYMKKTERGMQLAVYLRKK